MDKPVDNCAISVDNPVNYRSSPLPAVPIIKSSAVLQVVGYFLTKRCKKKPPSRAAFGKEKRLLFDDVVEHPGIDSKLRCGATSPRDKRIETNSTREHDRSRQSDRIKVYVVQIHLQVSHR